MTKAQAIDLQAKWKQQELPPLCEHLKVEWEQTEDGGMTGCYHCTSCGDSVPR